MTRKHGVIAAAALVAVATVALGASARMRRSPDLAAGAPAAALPRVIVATGRVAAATEITLANKIPGRIKAVLVDEGHPVSAGQPLILFDDQEHLAQVRIGEARVAAAHADVERARRRLDAARARWREVKSGPRPQEIEGARAVLDEARERWRNVDQERERFHQLLQSGYIARSQYDGLATDAEIARARTRAAEEALALLLAGPRAESVETAWAVVREAEAELERAERQLTQATAELDYARAALRTTVVEATINGRVMRKLVEPGEAVDIGMPLMSIADVGKTIVKAEVDETDLGKLVIGLSVEITADAFPGRVFRGTVVEIGQMVGKRKVRPEDPVKIQDMKVLETKVLVHEGGADLRLGMTVDVRIVASQSPGARAQ